MGSRSSITDVLTKTWAISGTLGINRGSPNSPLMAGADCPSEPSSNRLVLTGKATSLISSNASLKSTLLSVEVSALSFSIGKLGISLLFVTSFERNSRNCDAVSSEISFVETSLRSETCPLSRNFCNNCTVDGSPSDPKLLDSSSAFEREFKSSPGKDNIEIISKKLLSPAEALDPFDPTRFTVAREFELLALLFPITVIGAPWKLFHVRTAIFVPFIDRV